MYHQRATIHCDNFEFIINGSLLQHVSFDSIQFGSSCATNATLREKWCIFSFWHQRNHESQSNLLPNFLCASGNDFRLLYDNDSVFDKLCPLHLENGLWSKIGHKCKKKTGKPHAIGRDHHP